MTCKGICIRHKVMVFTLFICSRIFDECTTAHFVNAHVALLLLNAHIGKLSRIVEKPRRWDIKFMIVFGPLSTVFDFSTFGILLFVFHILLPNLGQHGLWNLLFLLPLLYLSSEPENLCLGVGQETISY